MKYVFQTIILFLTFYTCYSQNNDRYFFSSEIKQKLKVDTIPQNYQHYSINYMNIGDYMNTLITEELFVEKYKGLNKKKFIIDSTFRSYHPVNAIEGIVRESLKHQIVIINEAHFSAQNRVFSKAVIEQLYKLGFRTLFVEDLANKQDSNYDKDLNKRGFPLQTTGYYMKEPQYGNMIRKASQIGYKVLPYEYIPNDSIRDPMERWSLRENGQAQHILDYLKLHSNDKIIIHCGYGHLGEKLYEGHIGMMGAILKLKSGIDPFTISQTFWLETYSDKTINPYRKLIDSNPPKFISIFKDVNGNYFSSDKESYDVEVYFPKTKYVNGRPDWLIMTNDRMYVDIPFSEITLDYPYLVKAYYKNEIETNAVPADIVEIISENDIKALVLEKGIYHLKIESKNGKNQNLSVTVK